MSNEEWIRQIEAGEREAFRAAYEKYGQSIYQRILEETGDKDQAQVILKDIFRTFLREIRSADGDPIRFLLRGLTDLQLKDYRQQKASEAASEEDSEPAAVSAEPPKDEPEAPADVRDETPLDRAVSEFSGEYEEVCFTPDSDSMEIPEEASEEPEPVQRSHKGLLAFLIVIFILLGLLTLWVGAGVLMSYSVIPSFDLGYEWFNEHIFLLFRF